MATTDYCLLWISSELTCMPRTDWAAWAQAIGSLLGLGIAIAVPAIQHRTETARRQRDEMSAELRSIAICAAVAQSAHDSLSHATELLRQPTDQLGRDFWARITLTKIQGFTSTMRGIPVHTLAAGLTATRWLALISQLEECIGIVGRGESSIPYMEGVRQVAYECTQTLEKHLAALLDFRR